MDCRAAAGLPRLREVQGAVWRGSGSCLLALDLSKCVWLRFHDLCLCSGALVKEWAESLGGAEWEGAKWRDGHQPL